MRTTLFCLAAAAAVTTVAVAQPAPPTEQQRAAWMQAHEAGFAKMRQQRADDIALLIGLTPAQRPAFDQMMAAMEPPHREGDKDDRPPMGPMGPGAPDETMAAKLDHMSAMIDTRSAGEKSRLATLKAFYAGLAPDQKLRFDALDRLRHDHDMMGRHGGPGGHEHGPGGPGGPAMMPPPPQG